jgi:hypothetical protein
MRLAILGSPWVFFPDRRGRYEIKIPSPDMIIQRLGNIQDQSPPVGAIRSRKVSKAEQIFSNFQEVSE